MSSRAQGENCVNFRMKCKRSLTFCGGTQKVIQLHTIEDWIHSSCFHWKQLQILYLHSCRVIIVHRDFDFASQFIEYSLFVIGDSLNNLKIKKKVITTHPLPFELSGRMGWFFINIKLRGNVLFELKVTCDLNLSEISDRCG